MELLKGKPVVDRLVENMEARIEELLENNIVPTLAIVRVGNNESDIAYENNAIKKAKSLGVFIEKFIFEENADEDDVIEILKYINDNKNIHGVLMFRPLPKHMNEERVCNHLSQDKDIDGITDLSLGNIFNEQGGGFPPCTAEAAMAILKMNGIEIAGKKAVVVGRSRVIGKPVAMMLLSENATVTICHSKTSAEDLKKYCLDADIIITAAGKRNMITAEHVNGKQIVIDVGINFDEEGKMCGDADFEAVKDNVKAITPVPGGVGGVTTTLLMYHVVSAAMGMLK